MSLKDALEEVEKKRYADKVADKLKKFAPINQDIEEAIMWAIVGDNPVSYSEDGERRASNLRQALAQRETNLLKAEQKRIAKLLSFELAYPVEELEYLIERKPL